MTIDISDNNPRISYTVAAGVTQTSFTVPFEFFANTDLNVYVDGVLKTITTDYTVTGGEGSTGTVTISVTGPKTVTLTRDTTIERVTDFPTGIDINRAALNTQLDTLTAISADVKDLANRAIRVNDFDLASNLELPTVANRANKVLTFDTEGNVQAETALDLFAGGVVGANFVNNTATGDGSTTTFGLTSAPGVKNNIQIYIDGVYQNKATYSISGASVTFSEAPPVGASIEFIIGQAVTAISGDSDAITYTQGASGSQERTVTSKLQEFVSVKDFGAIGDGATDDTAAIQAAINSGTKTIFFPRGIYFVGTQLTVGSASSLAQFVGDGYLSSEIKCAVSGVNIFLERANVEFFGLRFIPAPSAVNPIAVKSALPTNFADCDVWFRECWLDTGIYIAHQVVGRGSQFDSCILKCTTVMEITAPNPYNYSGSLASQPPEAGMRRYRVTDCDIDGVDTLIKAPNNTTADKYIHNVVVSGNTSNGLDFLFRGQSLRDSSIVNNVILVTENGTLIESLIAVKYISNVTISGNYFAGWSNPTVTITGRWNALISVTNDPFDFTDTTSLNETLVDNLTVVGNVIKDIKNVVLYSYGNIKRIIATGNTFERLFETSTGSTTTYLFNCRNYSDLTFAHNTISSDTGLIAATQFYLANGSAGSNGNEFLFSNDSSFTLSSEKPTWTTGSGTPEGAVTAVVGSMYTRTDGGAGTSFYIKESGTSNTGWVAK